MKSKTITATLPGNPQTLLSLLANYETLPQWNTSFCRSVRKNGEGWIADSPRGEVGFRMIRDDRSGLVDLIFQMSQGELVWAMRILPNGSGSELVLTLVQSEGISDSTFHEHTRWAEKASRELKKLAESEPLPSPSFPAVVGGESMDPLPKPAGDDVKGNLETGIKRLFIGNLPFDWTEENLRQHFAASGQVVSAEVATFGRSGRSRGFGFIEMSTEAETQAAIDQLHGSLAGTRKIVVRISRPRENRAPAEAERLPEPAPAPRRSRREHGERFTHRQQRDRESGVIATGEYEFFPRGQAVSSESDIPSEPEIGNRLSDASPYIDDTGDIENRGNRRPPHRPGRHPHRRGPRRSLRPK